ncbi:MAG: hypothetical protein ACK5KP_09520 [Paludibacteraceae bacterium]
MEFRVVAVPMKENEVIIVNGIPDVDYANLISACVKYAVISLPFTVNRMAIDDVKKRVLNIAKGKIAESLFGYFCEKNTISPDFKTCTTPFWTTDRKDFILNNDEWDIKNNFIYYPNNQLKELRYSDLPALVPDRYHGDQWSKRNKVEFSETTSPRFLFTFLQNTELNDGVRGREFLEIILSEAQIRLLRKLDEKFKGNPQESSPFSEEKFWEAMLQKGDVQLFKLNLKPSLVITAYACAKHWDFFKNTGKSDETNNFQHYLNPTWYVKTPSGAINFMTGTLWTKITNATTPVAFLPSFLSLFPRLRDDIACAVIKK